jgi:hypothetical protein
LLLAITFEVELLDGFDSNLLLLQEDLIGFWSELVCEFLDVLRERSREEDVLDIRRERPDLISYAHHPIHGV